MFRLSQPEAGDVVRGVEVRPVGAAERPLWDKLMQEHHYLGFQGMIGESLRYVAVYQDHWLALLGWSSAALKCRVRDQWIGWTPSPQTPTTPPAREQLPLPHPARRQRASSGLTHSSLNLRRLSDDWQAAHGHPIWLAETFVDPRLLSRHLLPSRRVDLSRKHSRGLPITTTYTHHGRIKSVFVRPLRPDAPENSPTPMSRWNSNSRSHR